MKLQITKYLSCILATLVVLVGPSAIGQKITGTVSSQYGEAIVAVNVAIKDSNKGGITDEKGIYVINDVEPGTYTLVFSSIGFQTLEKSVRVTANSTSQASVTLRVSSTELSEVFVTGEYLKEENRTITVNEINFDQIRNLHIEQPLRLIEQVAGVDLVAYRQGGVADQFSIRGFGGGGHAGEAGVQIDGISLNEAEGHSDGYADMNILIPLNLRSMKVYKGPSSALFGRFAQGGTLALETRRGGNYQDMSVSGGSWNTFDAQVAIGREIPVGDQSKKLTTNLAFQAFQTDGYADNSNIVRGNITGRIAYDLTDKTDVALSLRGHSSRWDAPGYISESQFNDEDRRHEQDEFAEDDGGDKQFYSQRLDINHTFNDNLRLLVFGYAVQQEFTRWAKFGFSPGGQTERFNTRDVMAFGTSLNGNSQIGSTMINWIGGLEFYDEETQRMRWNSSNRVRGEQTEDRIFGIQSVSAFAQADIEISRYFRPSIGLRYDTYFGNFTANDPNQTPIDDDIDGLSNLSPKIGVRSTISRNLDLRASASQGFSLPNSALKYVEGINLDPIILWQYEVGANYRKSDWLELDVVGFMLNSSNEIFENPPGSLQFQNVGATQRMGVESSLILTPIQGLRVAGTFSYITTEVTENPDDGLEGLELVNVPQTIATVDVSYVSKMGLGGRVMFRDVGEYFTSTDNLATYDGYTVTNASIFYEFNPMSVSSNRIFFEVKNVFDALYAEAVFGDVGSQLFGPAPTRNFVLGINYSFN
jgi:outer membrane receptor protein involved in Fe transport